MFRYLFGSDGDAQGTPPDTFSVAFSGAYLSLFRPKMFFYFSPSHIAAPPAKGLTIADGISFVAPAPVTFSRLFVYEEFGYRYRYRYRTSLLVCLRQTIDNIGYAS